MTKDTKERIERFFDSHWEEFEREVWPQLTPREQKDTIVAMLNYRYPRLQSVGVTSSTTGATPGLDLLKKIMEEK